MTDLTNLSNGSTVAGCCTTGSCGHADGAGEIERLRKRLQACQSNDDYALTDDVITQNERWLLADNERLRNQQRELIDAFRIVVRDWCPSSVKVPVLDAYERGPS